MLTVVGEALVDVVSRGTLTQSFVGGSPLNVAVGLARLDHPVQFLGCYGRDERGRMVSVHLRDSSVLVPLGPDEYPTSVARAVIGSDGAAEYEFDLHWDLPVLAERAAELLNGTTLVHTGSIATYLEPGDSAVLAFVEQARPNATISFDPNCRPSINGDVQDVRARVEHFVALADVVKASDEDLAWLYPGVDPLDSARSWVSSGPGLVVVTRGGEGPVGFAAAGQVAVAAPSVDVADTVGAGDSFTAALLSQLVDRDYDGGANRERLRSLGLAELESVLEFSARAAAITVSRAGANPPSRHELALRLSDRE